MKSALLFILLSVAVLGRGEEVLVLDDETFSEATDSYDILLVNFMNPQCPHCEKFAPIFEETAEEITKQELPYTLGEIDVNINRKMGEYYDINMTPTLLLFLKGRPIKYHGDRTESKFLFDFINQKTQPAPRLTTKEEIESTISLHRVSVYIFAEEGSETQKIGDRLSKSLDGIKFFQVSDANLLEAVGENGSLPQIVLMKQFDEKKNVMKGDTTSKWRVRAFVNEKSTPLVLPMDLETVNTNLKGGNLGVVLFRNLWDPNREEMENAFARIAVQNQKDDFYFAIDNRQSTGGSKMSWITGIKDSDLPCVFIVKHKSEGANKFIMDKSKYNLDYEGMSAFYNDWKHRKLEKHYKSQPIPELIEDEPVLHVVGLTFEDFVLKTGKDVIVKFYLPWCGACKAFGPVFEDLAIELSHNENLVFAEMDASENEAPDLGDMKHFPSIKFYMGSKKGMSIGPLNYNREGKTRDDLVAFIKENSYHPVTEFKFDL